jgi:hypothetical protein
MHFFLRGVICSAKQPTEGYKQITMGKSDIQAVLTGPSAPVMPTLPGALCVCTTPPQCEPPSCCSSSSSSSSSSSPSGSTKLIRLRARAWIRATTGGLAALWKGADNVLQTVAAGRAAFRLHARGSCCCSYMSLPVRQHSTPCVDMRGFKT